VCIWRKANEAGGRDVLAGITILPGGDGEKKIEQNMLGEIELRKQ
jgi:hypothetical protein